MISIIIPVYNQSAKLKKCLASIVTQSYQDYEVIVVDDGSPSAGLRTGVEDVASVVESFKSKLLGKLQMIRQDNQGSNPARNAGRTLAHGEYLLFCDADIVMKPDMLETLLNTLLANPDKAYAYGSFRYGWKKFRPGEFSAEKLRTAPFIHTTALIRTEAFTGFDNKLKRFQDWDLWLTMLAHGHEGVFVDQIVFDVATGGSISTWLPSFVYKLLPQMKQVQKYKEAEKIIKQKHGLE